MSEFVVDVQRLRCNVNKIRSKVNVDKLFYAVKANSDEIILEELHKLGCGFEIASINEYKKVISTGACSNNIICGLPVKPVNLIYQLNKENVDYFVFEDMKEYDKLVMYAPETKKIMRIYISDIDREAAPWGIKYQEIKSIILDNNEFLENVNGVSFHIARNYQIRKIEKVFERIEEVLYYFPEKKMILNLGGGFREELLPHLALKYNLNNYYQYINEKIKQIKNKYDLLVYCEPGRGIVETACSIITEIELVTERNGVDAVFVDLNIGTPVGSHPYKITLLKDGVEEEIYNIQNRMDKTSKKSIETTFFDTICEYVSFFTLPLECKLCVGQKIKMYGMGAYTTVRSSEFHSRSCLTSIKENNEG